MLTGRMIAFIVYIFTKSHKDITSDDCGTRRFLVYQNKVLVNRWLGCGMNKITEYKPQICLSRITFLFLHQTVCNWVFNKRREVSFNEVLWWHYWSSFCHGFFSMLSTCKMKSYNLKKQNKSQLNNDSIWWLSRHKITTSTHVTNP